jgi:hypothetical protein
MAYNPDNLSALTYGNGFTLWHYKTTDSRDLVESPGYFAKARPMLRVCDRIHLDAHEACADFVVKRNDGETVDLGRMTSWVGIPAPVARTA